MAQKMGHQNLVTTIEIVAASLRSREGWKYEELKKFLDREGLEYEFEHVVGDCIFDLALPGKKTLIEFDGTYHSGKQLEQDRWKNRVGEALGWTVVRIETPDNQVIPSSVLYDWI